jgi:membrane associated rhomboid family serine protease
VTESQFGSTANPEHSPRCKNHPDVVSYVRCQSCNEPICPQCMVQAVVGVQCPQCVKTSRAKVRTPKTITGAEQVHGRPYVTLTIIGLCVVAWLLELTVGWSDFTSEFVFVPFLGAQEPWRFLTAAFLHSDSALYHILFNMFALYSVGSQLEYILGRWHYLSLYVLSALGGSVAVLLLAQPVDGWVRRARSLVCLVRWSRCIARSGATCAA